MMFGPLSGWDFSCLKSFAATALIYRGIVDKAILGYTVETYL